jgi:hypothetical protein
MYEITDIQVKELARQGYNNSPELQVIVSEDPEPRIGEWQFYTFVIDREGNFTQEWYSEDGSNYDVLAYKTDGVLASYGVAHEGDQKEPFAPGMGALSAWNCVSHSIDEMMSEFRGHPVAARKHEPECVGVTNMWSSRAQVTDELLGTELHDGAYRINGHDTWYAVAMHVRPINVRLEQLGSPFRLVHCNRLRIGDSIWLPLIDDDELHKGYVTHMVMKYAGEPSVRDVSRPGVACTMHFEACWKMGHYRPVEEVYTDVATIEP